MITTEIVEALKRAIEIIENEKPKKPKKFTNEQDILNFRKLLR